MDYPRCPECGGGVKSVTAIDNVPAKKPHVHNPSRLNCVTGHRYGYKCPVEGCDWKPAPQATPSL